MIPLPKTQKKLSLFLHVGTTVEPSMPSTVPMKVLIYFERKKNTSEMFERGKRLFLSFHACGILILVLLKLFFS